MGWHVLPARGISLKVVIALIYVGLVIACASAIAFLTYRENSALILASANDSFKKTGAFTISNTEYLLQPVGAAVDALATLIDEDGSFATRESLSRLLYEMATLYPHIYSSYLGAADDGRFVQVQRIDDGAREWGPDAFPVPHGARFVLRTVAGSPPNRTDSYRYLSDSGQLIAEHAVGGAVYDPRERLFFAAAMARPDRVLTDTYTFASNGKAGVTIARRIEHDGKPIGVVAADITLESLSEFLTAQPVGKHGAAIIVDGHGHIIAAPDQPATGLAPGWGAKRIADLQRPELDAAWAQYQQTRKTTFTFAQPNGDYIAAFHPFPPSFEKDWAIMEVAPVDDFVGRLKATIRQIAWLSLGIAVLGGLGSLFLAGQITKPIEMLTQEADRIRSLSFAGAIENTSRIREIRQLIESMAALKTAVRTLSGEDIDQSTVSTLIQQADQNSPSAKLFRKIIEAVETKRSRETELELAAAIQKSGLPSQVGDADQPVLISARMRAAREVGGDFYDWVWREQGRLAFVIGDVSGKGIPAALFMSSTRTAIRTMFMSGASLADTIAGTNRLLSENNDGCFFVTLFAAELDTATGRLTYINAGHEPAQILSASRTMTSLDPCGPALGVAEDFDFPCTEIVLYPGDTFIALTDGVTDAVDAKGERFGEQRLQRTVSANESGDPAGVVDQIFSAVDAFAGSEVQFDDITCLALRFQPHREASRTLAA